MMNGLDSAAQEVRSRRFLFRDDPYLIAAETLGRLRAVKAIDEGFDGILSRTDDLPWNRGQDSIPLRELALCRAIPKMSVGRRASAFDAMLDTFERRFKPEAPHRSHFLVELAPIVASLRAQDQGAAIKRLFGQLVDIGDAVGLRMTRERLPFKRLQVERRPLLDDLVALARGLPAEQLRDLLQLPGRATIAWIDAFEEGPDRDHARRQVQGLRNLYISLV
jgi:hypothetical protein